MCLLKSIPIRDLFSSENIKYRKVNVTSDYFDKYTSTYPSLLFFMDGKMIGKVEGFYDMKDKEKMKSKVEKILDQSSD